MRILVAMSGGVDSSVVAAMLHEAGHEVVGATLQLYDHGAATAKKGACCAGQDIHDARMVADTIGIPHYVLDREARFREAVIADFADSYARGETPIPCVRCNQSVKFQDLAGLARDLGCEALATGHYARRVEGPDGAELHMAADVARDQSYFLFATTQAQLDQVRFPLGDMPDKTAVRAMAERLGLAVAQKPDSQDICFVPEGRYSDLVAKLRPDAAEPGEIVHADGRVLGTHAGIARYTVGQSRGLGMASRDGQERLFVTGVESTTRRIIVAPRAATTTDEVMAGEVNWLIAPPVGAFACFAKLRARELPQPAIASWDPELGLLRLVPGNPAVAAPGQAMVLYDAEGRLLCGGFIKGRARVDTTRVAA
ncbi:tRNA (5-methylaminomethyl-2-thiouridylate)-methyltransferase [Humitalea rosea]|uniref:tRNA-specific 2-thiouridylase MnmA n=1 Tax=Humitalea rosea TaxID=990373 RepID=A0A2W7KB15_9PROT|nr:tRNA 2-thiouridine(34) synthase MnmA [Humitalea rosea]PZW44790.1 tRNA (5-methylaminomethyl-2-thiouridylate)-methyltransferase [Humitalea rosea]